MSQETGGVPALGREKNFAIDSMSSSAAPIALPIMMPSPVLSFGVGSSSPVMKEGRALQ